MTDEIKARARRYAALNNPPPHRPWLAEMKEFSALEIGLGAIGLFTAITLFVAISSWQQPVAACEGAGTPPAPSHLKQDRLAVPS